MLYEVSPDQDTLDIYRNAKIIVWLKLQTTPRQALLERLNWEFIYENEIAYVFRNTAKHECVRAPKAKVPFSVINSILFLIFLSLVVDIAGLPIKTRHTHPH
jgi:hypothetical protein